MIANIQRSPREVNISISIDSPRSKRQRAFNQLGMIELITRLLDEINATDSPDLLQAIKKQQYSKASEYKQIILIYMLCYELLESISANNYSMKLKISTYLHKYLEQILRTENKVVYRSIQEVLDRNHLALEEKVNPEYIHRLIQSFDTDHPDPADLYFLSRLCICKEQTIKRNQDAIFQHFYD